MSTDLPCRDFVSNCTDLRTDLLEAYFASPPTTAVGESVRKLVEAGADAYLLQDLLNQALTDSFVALLYGLGGAASLGKDQQRYDVLDEDGRNIVEDWGGDLESYAYELFVANTGKESR